MHQITHQTVKLGKGKHRSPQDGACVMELASMLAGEAFTDHPRSVCRVIAAFLRSYNDMLDDRRRQDLYGYASKCVGSAAGVEVERLRAQRLLDWAEGDENRRWPAAMLYRLRRHFVREDPRASAQHAIQAMGRLSDRRHQAVLGLLDELISIRDESGRDAEVATQPGQPGAADAHTSAAPPGRHQVEGRDLQRGGVA